ncbi:MAG: cell division protein FtsL [Pseudorhodobacter sp.]|nr:cell division protein FtsL [Pseudorhodobacter sp.]
MRPILYLLSFLLVLGSAFWAYRENYATQHQLKEIAALQDEIATLHEGIALQRAEWAYLNRPDRLRDLATINFDRLGLLPMEPEQFGTSAEIGYPAPPQLQISGTVDTVGSLNPDEISKQIAKGSAEQTP